jgi:hypothetical protein
MAERPDRYRNAIAPHIYVNGAYDGIAFNKALGAVELFRIAPTITSESSLRDPFGHLWVLLSWKEHIVPSEIERRGSALLGVS